MEQSEISDFREAVTSMLSGTDFIIPKKIRQSLQWKPEQWFRENARQSEIDEYLSLLSKAEDIMKGHGLDTDKVDVVRKKVESLESEAGAYDSIIGLIASVDDALGFSSKVATDEYGALLSTLDAAKAERLLTAGEYERLLREVVKLQARIGKLVKSEELRKAAEEAKAEAKAEKKKYKQQMQELKAKAKAEKAAAKKEAAAFDKKQFGEKLPSRISPYMTSELPDEDLGLAESFVPTFADFLKFYYE